MSLLRMECNRPTSNGVQPRRPPAPSARRPWAATGGATPCAPQPGRTPTTGGAGSIVYDDGTLRLRSVLTEIELGTRVAAALVAAGSRGPGLVSELTE